MKKILTKIMFAILGGGMALAAPIVPSDNQIAGQFNTKEKVENHRRFLEERAVYITENADRLNLPQRTRDSAVIAKDKWEDKLVEDGFVDVKGGVVKDKPTKKESVIETIIGMNLVNRALAFTFGKEDFESCGAIPCSFDTDETSGSNAMSLDSTSKVAGTDSLRCDTNGAGADCALSETIASDDIYYIQMKVFLPTGWTIGASSYLTLFSTDDGASTPFYCSLEDFGPVRITCFGDTVSYIDTGLNLALNTVHTLEFRMKVSATVGDLDVWVNNTIEGSPDYNGSGVLNSGVVNIAMARVGGYRPDIVNDMYYDDYIVNTTFIGNGVETTDYRSSTMKGGGTVKGGAILK